MAAQPSEEAYRLVFVALAPFSASDSIVRSLLIFTIRSPEKAVSDRRQNRHKQEKNGLDRILTKLVERSAIGMAFFVMNSEKILRLLRLLLALLVSLFIAIMCLFAPNRRTALLGAF